MPSPSVQEGGPARVATREPGATSPGRNVDFQAPAGDTRVHIPSRPH
ncbi:hypothetical protein D187_003050 [Cystobacter fuscus DSM 2262]|uniref:Uncharacterized protein n=1 Tax=Cystobacter fuscus (strain ATCC 25194 / DSM 2262 / NBRC 100088 / M29) TaxID=1242864 RepID=S9P7Q8_CYSF2|nr:hypothetical protein D187_003050 [Cystobacter fuscus DSM 2262]